MDTTSVPCEEKKRHYKFRCRNCSPTCTSPSTTHPQVRYMHSSSWLLHTFHLYRQQFHLSCSNLQCISLATSIRISWQFICNFLTFTINVCLNSPGTRVSIFYTGSCTIAETLSTLLKWSYLHELDYSAWQLLDFPMILCGYITKPWTGSMLLLKMALTSHFLLILFRSSMQDYKEALPWRTKLMHRTSTACSDLHLFMQTVSTIFWQSIAVVEKYILNRTSQVPLHRSFIVA